MKKIAYLVLAHDDVEMLERLITSLDYMADFYVHYDKTSNLNLKNLKKYPNVNFVKQVSVYWAGYSVVEATNNLIDAVVESSTTYAKVVLLSGHDFPLYSKEYIYKKLTKTNRNYIRGFKITNMGVEDIQKEIISPHINDLFLFKKNSWMFKITRKTLNLFLGLNLFNRKEKIIFNNVDSFDVYKGSQWWALNQDVIEYFYNFCHYDNRNRKYKRYMKYVFAPDEKFFHSLFFNSVFNITNGYSGPEKFPYKKYNDMEKGILKTTFYMPFFENIHLIHPSLSKTYTYEDIVEVQNERQSRADTLFIRKVDSKKSVVLLDCLASLMEDENDFSNNKHI